ncbi:MAG: Lrp/AsnC family transcriptional regulator [Micrococcales bacterium]
METLDRLIVERLAKDSSISVNELASQLDVPSSTLHQRIKKLEAKGVILGYQAKVNQQEVGLKLSALVSLTPIDPAKPDDVAALIEPIEEIESCWSVAGTESYIVKVSVGEPGELEALLAQIRAVANVSTRTTVILSTPFEGRQATIPKD